MIYRDAYEAEASGPLACTGPFQGPGRGPSKCPRNVLKSYQFIYESHLIEVYPNLTANPKNLHGITNNEWSN
jgi:hypothetical protein